MPSITNILFFCIFIQFHFLRLCFCSNEKILIQPLSCQSSESGDPLAVTVSPGFLTGAIPYVGHHACTENGTCENIPFICPTSSCCLPGTDIASTPALASSHCGCWDSKRKTCKPVKSLRLDWETCKTGFGIQEKTNFELVSSDNNALFCDESGTSVEFETRKEAGSMHFRLITKLCLLKDRRHRDLLGPVEKAVNKVQQQIDLDANKNGISGDFKLEEISTRNVSRDTTAKVLKRLTYYSKKYANKEKFVCGNRPGSGSAVVSMSPSFSLGSVSNLLSQNSEVCSLHGECIMSMPACKNKGCCLMSNGGNFGGCDCMANSSNCLLHHKVLNVAGQGCTKNGEKVKADLKIKLPGEEFNECKENDSSVASMKFEQNDAGNIEITVETKQCILSSANRKYLEVETKIISEVNINQFWDAMEVFAE